jgi:hypothetical protein
VEAEDRGGFPHLQGYDGESDGRSVSYETRGIISLSARLKQYSLRFCEKLSFFSMYSTLCLGKSDIY